MQGAFWVGMETGTARARLKRWHYETNDRCYGTSKQPVQVHCFLLKVGAHVACMLPHSCGPWHKGFRELYNKQHSAVATCK